MPDPKKKRLLLALGAVCLLAGTAIYLANQKTAGTYEDAREATPQLFTAFKDKVNDVARISMRSKGQDFVIAKDAEGKWVMPDRFNYPVEFAKVQSILLNAAELEILERKTDDPKKLDRIGLGDTESKESDAVRVSFFDKSGAILSNFVAGKRRIGGGYALYVRKEHDSQAYLVKGDGWMRLDLGPDYWLGAERFRMEKEEIAKITISRADKTDGMTLERAHNGARKFRVEAELPEGKEEDESKANDVAFSLSELSLAGVVPEAEAELKPETAVIAAFRTFGGLEMTVDVRTDKDGDALAAFSAGVGANASDPVKQRAEAINAAAKGWRYVLTPESATKLTATPKHLVKEEKPKEEEKAAPADGKPADGSTP
jgi:hypothetical protein